MRISDWSSDVCSSDLREAPFYFLKSALSYVPSGSTIPYPPGTSDYHYEMELVMAIGAPVFKADKFTAAKAIYAYGAGLDMTRRDQIGRASCRERVCQYV